MFALVGLSIAVANVSNDVVVWGCCRHLPGGREEESCCWCCSHQCLFHTRFVMNMNDHQKIMNGVVISTMNEQMNGEQQAGTSCLIVANRIRQHVRHVRKTLRTDRSYGFSRARKAVFTIVQYLNGRERNVESRNTNDIFHWLAS